MTVVELNDALCLKHRQVQNSMTARIRSGGHRMLGTRLANVRSGGMQGRSRRIGQMSLVVSTPILARLDHSLTRDMTATCN